MALIRNDDDDEMTTTMTATATSMTKQKPRWKWSGEDEPQSEYCHEDTDTMTLTADEKRYIVWYDANAHKEWHNADEDEAEAPPAPPAPSHVLPAFWTTPFSIACGEEPVFEPDYPDYEEDEEFPHVPFMNLTKAERDQKSAQFKFGLCTDCDAGLDDQIEFVCLNKGGFMCNACHDYYHRVALTGCGGGCN